MDSHNPTSFADHGLTFQNVTYSVSPEKTILRDCFGRFRPGEVCAIMGESGSGKSTLLNLLSARMKWSGRLSKKADIHAAPQLCARGSIDSTPKPFPHGDIASADAKLADVERDDQVEAGGDDTHLLLPAAAQREAGQQLQPFDPISPRDHKFTKLFGDLQDEVAYVFQDDQLLATETVFETVMFSAQLRRPDLSKEERLEKVNELLEVLGLTACKDVKIGSALSKGISGGQRKRTSVAVELVMEPKILFLDEPTSGLDNPSAERLTAFLQHYAKEKNATVVCTIHQPSEYVLQQFDRVLVLQKGKTAIFGTPKQKACFSFAEDQTGQMETETSITQIMEAAGRKMPMEYGSMLGQWLSKVMAEMTEDEMGVMQQKSKESFQRLCTAEVMARASTTEVDPNDTSAKTKSKSIKSKDLGRANLFVQLGSLIARDFRKLYRDYSTLGLSVGSAVFMPILTLMFWWAFRTSQLEEDQDFQTFSGYTDFVAGRTSLLILVNLSIGFLNAMPVVATFPTERPIFLREYSSKSYNVFSYFFSKLVIEIIPLVVSVLIVLSLTKLSLGLYANFGLVFVASSTLAVTTSSLALLVSSCTSTVTEAIQLLALLVTLQFMSSGAFFAVKYIPVGVYGMRYLFGVKFASNISLRSEFKQLSEEKFLDFGPQNAMIGLPGNSTALLEQIHDEQDIMMPGANPQATDAIDFAYLLMPFFLYRSLAVLILHLRSRYAVK
ncbi:unnamed protein product [Amoebophrya sp. A120]|nr:unnamed protein product [Amoebophrya sp. A120]|eukprot:GSA120T00007468001.1